jgi:integral membrane protein (TIGR01906 family)
LRARIPAVGPGLAFGLTAVCTCLAIAGAAVILLLNPIWVDFEQRRSDVTGLTGYSAPEVSAVTGSILSDLVFGPPNFDVAVGGAPVLTERERSHMADVRHAFGLAGIVVLAGCVVLVAVGVGWRGGARFWRAVRAGGLLAVGVVAVAGTLSVLFFDQAFELMHRLFFASGTYTFNPRTDKLVQLFPDQSWFESAVALAVAMMVIGVAVAAGAGRLAGRASAEALAAGESS